MIVGFSQKGYFGEAFGHFRELRREGIALNEVSLTGVLSACAQAGAFEFGKIIHGLLEKAGFIWMISVNNALLDTYAKCGDVAMVDKIMYTFMAGIKQDKIIKEAYEKLKEIMLRLRLERGYAPEVGNVLYDIEDEEKEDSISSHSEKLAVAFGIGRLCRGKMIRIVKNLRICKDCHVLMKLISQVYDVEIVVRDRSRFHTFKSGSCSCRDYW
ncbi:Pentatricopeptide repeat-containing protein At1g74630 [Linum grandiflorum]